MQKRKIITVFFMGITAVLALMISLTDMFGKGDMVCATSACVKVHSSSFATVFNLPVGIYAALFLVLALCMYLKGKTVLSAVMLWALFGLESYYTFIQFVFIESLCVSCLIFFCLLITCIIASCSFKKWPVFVMGPMTMVSMFLAAHFVFFFPSATLKPTLIQSLPKRAADIEIFASSSCAHCEDAIEQLQKVCTAGGKKLVIRPVSISAKDREKSVQWVSGELFKCGTATSFRLAEKIVWENEADAKKLSGDNLQVPLILVRTDNLQKVFTGWNRQVQEKIFNLFEVIDGETGTAEAVMLPGFIESENHGAYCSTASGCHASE